MAVAGIDMGSHSTKMVYPGGRAWLLRNRHDLQWSDSEQDERSLKTTGKPIGVDVGTGFEYLISNGMDKR